MNTVFALVIISAAGVPYESPISFNTMEQCVKVTQQIANHDSYCVSKQVPTTEEAFDRMNTMLQMMRQKFSKE